MIYRITIDGKWVTLTALPKPHEVSGPSPNFVFITRELYVLVIKLDQLL